jgi:hypothetical protein
MRRYLRILISLIVVTMLLAGCGDDDESASMTMVAAEQAGEAPADAEAEAGAFAPSAGNVTTAIPVDLKIIREAYLSMRVEIGTFDTAWNRLQVIASDNGGYMSNAALSVVETDTGERYYEGTVSIRVPVNNFDGALDDLEGIGERLSLDITSQDVTQEYSDWEAQLRHTEAMEDFYLGLLDQATTVAEALEVHRELEQVQLDLERITGYLQYLEDRTSFSTIMVSVTERPADEPEPEPEPEPGRFSKILTNARNALVDAFGVILVVLAALAPFLVAAAIGLAVWLGIRVRRQKVKKSQAGEAPEKQPPASKQKEAKTKQ